MTDGQDITCDTREDNAHAWSILVRGEIDIRTAPRLAGTIDDTIAKGAQLIIVRLEHVSFIDSSGLRVLLSGADRMAAGGGRLVVDGATPVIERLLEVSGTIERLRRRPEEET